MQDNSTPQICMLSFPDSAALTVTIQSNATVQEGDTVELCVILDGIPSGGTNISVEVFLGAIECGAGKRSNAH